MVDSFGYHRCARTGHACAGTDGGTGARACLFFWPVRWCNRDRFARVIEALWAAGHGMPVRRHGVPVRRHGPRGTRGRLRVFEGEELVYPLLRRGVW